jgi:PPOX class probable F420-dependent enzyme
MTAGDPRALFATARVARLATAGAAGTPHLVPICFALDGDTIYSAVDHKPKRTTRLRRLENLRDDPRASALADHYDEDWSTLWWVRADGTARIVPAGEADHTRAVALLASRYRQYLEDPPEGPAIVLSVLRWSQWRYDQPTERWS